MRDREQERAERRKYEGDVAYEVWRHGGNPDRVDFDRVERFWYDGRYSEEAAAAELRRMRRQSEPEPEEPECPEES